jgi:hypothetical protein
VEPYQALLTQGGLGLMAAIFFWLYMTERKDHQKTRDKNEQLMEARRVDAKETVDSFTAPLQGISQGIQMLSAKIESTKQQGKQ